MDNPIQVDLGRIAQDLQIRRVQVESVVQLLDEGNTVPFITRYRKERTGNLNEVVVGEIQVRVGRLRELAERKETILKTIEAQGKLSEELAAAIRAADNAKRLEDLYLPFKPKKKTKASDARDRGLEPLALRIWSRDETLTDLGAAAAELVAPEKDLATPEKVLEGVGHILAEAISEMAAVREAVRRVVWKTGRIVTTKAEIPEGQGLEYRDYFAYSEPVAHIPPHRVLAINRGDKEGPLKVKLEVLRPDLEEATFGQLPLEGHPHAENFRSAALDALDRLLLPSMEREVRRDLTDLAERHAVDVFARNLRSLLLQPPIPKQVVMAIDPGFRTGCKVAVLDGQGILVEHGVIHPHPPQNRRYEAKVYLKNLVGKHEVGVVAIGNGTACRETEELVAEIISEGTHFHQNPVPPSAEPAPPREDAPPVSPPEPDTPAAEASQPGEEAGAEAEPAVAELDPSPPEPEPQHEAEPTRPVNEGPPTPATAETPVEMLPPIVGGAPDEDSTDAEPEETPPPPSSASEAAAGDVQSQRAEALKSSESKRNPAEEGDSATSTPATPPSADEPRPEETTPIAGGAPDHEATDADPETPPPPSSAGEAASGADRSQESERLEFSGSTRNPADEGDSETTPEATPPPSADEPAAEATPPPAPALPEITDSAVPPTPDGAATSDAGPDLSPATDASEHTTPSPEPSPPPGDAERPRNARGGGGMATPPAGSPARSSSHGRSDTPRPPRPKQPPRPPEPHPADARLAQLAYVIVNEAGASVYSASPVGREEFPEYDATLRGTISIGRRLQDPLSELVKIEPQNIGVGLYQHDVNPKQLKESLETVIASCVNFVGVDLNTASVPLLRHVSGLNQLTARRVVDHRSQNGPYHNREQLMQVEGIGPITFTQAAGFLKIPASENPLDRTWVHPESYPVAIRVLERLGFTPEVIRNREELSALHARMNEADLPALAQELGVGEPTLRDIFDALARPERDPRDDLPKPIFKQGVLKLEDLTPGMELKGTVLNVVDFGAFVDIGLKDSGLVHISQLANRYIKSPHDVVSVGDVVTAWVMGVDGERKRVSLTMVKPGTERPRGNQGGGGARRGPGEPRGGGERRPEGQGRPPRREGQAPPQPVGAGVAVGDAPPRRPDRPTGGTGEGPGGRGPGGPRRDSGGPGRGGPRHQYGGGPGQGGNQGQGPGRFDRTPPPRPPVRPAKPAPPPPPLSKDALTGSVPLRTFGQLKQLWQARDDEPGEGAPPTGASGESNPPPAPESATPEPPAGEGGN